MDTVNLHLHVLFREDEASEEEGEDPALDSLSQAIAFQVKPKSRLSHV